jgi:NPCBM/NEW2 domain-containing protein
MRPLLTLLVAIFPVLHAARGAFADDSTLVTASNASIPARDVTLVAEGGELVVKYTDAAGRGQSIKAADVVELTLGAGRAVVAPKPAADDIEITLTTGDVLNGKVGAKSDDGIQLVSKVYGNPLVKFGQIHHVIFPANAHLLPKTLPAKADLTDIIFTKAGDRGTGSIKTVSGEGVVYYSEKQAKDVPLPAGNVAGIWLIEDPSMKSPKEPDRPFASILTSDSSSVRGEIHSLTQGVLTFTDLYGIEHKVAANLVTGIYMKNGRVVYLSDIKPSGVSEDANFIRGAAKLSSDLEFPFQADRSARGTKLILGGVEHRKGLGVRAYSALSYALGGTFKRFQATFGLDAVSRGLGSVVGEVWVDGKKVKEISLKGGDAPQTLDVDLAGAKELKLVVTWGGNGQSDFADWGSARLVR